jgi:superfamily I DNA/RNA helicase
MCTAPATPSARRAWNHPADAAVKNKTVFPRPGAATWRAGPGKGRRLTTSEIDREQAHLTGLYTHLDTLRERAAARRAAALRQTGGTPQARLERGAEVARAVPGAAYGANPDLEAAVVVLGVGQAKGLEFDSVLIADPAAILAGSPRGLSDLYVALTRSTQRLGILHAGPPPAELARIPEARVNRSADPPGAAYDADA